MIGRFLEIVTSQVVRVRGESMAPTLPDGALVVVARRAFNGTRRPERFDIVRFEDPTRRGRWLIKRIVGMPEEEVRLEDGRLLVDGREVVEDHIGNDSGVSGTHEWWPSAGEYVLLGDNRPASTDSRRFGVVSIGAFTGKVGRRLV